ncbi:DUF2934 domain-containing protein [Amaricoccus solimangrovi]|uniref:DUF2934 domain-containing protein n=1 Tax=Amaricoccus solimangrovi TaxID=2589815 RepID=A0A501WS20_9RHOB|nr:DUF2934 domain-containing protein [Amaricoccus solimangrovi]TPE52533.1 DUF2934 domain-containing protein [Amaricoccus solimangrovi]
MASDKEERIRAKAHDIWLSEGCPEGSEARHWEMATAAVEAEDAGAAPDVAETAPEPETAPAPKKRAPRAKKTPADPDAPAAPKRAPRTRKTTPAG